MAKIFPIHPANPHRICWGCDQYCSVDAMGCSNERSPHPSELFGDDWQAWGQRELDRLAQADAQPVVSENTVAEIPKPGSIR
ncbi:DUF3079 domain-containing protein [Rhodoferax sp. U2-2l]|uniref:DUF3079 domain-containing protein n=1 Tax=Rhodoferax sp. U2-2l TaxID=2884000 RepID=UPI001D0BC778|nr:DUF3079 domain-containing protein [Rhodoferax sp. U2-2l]MCB8748706.1 DUF3079 domain-containing protein [Rhodoferax sp. U2-2l]